MALQVQRSHEQPLHAVLAPWGADGESRPQNSGTQRRVLLLVGKVLWLAGTVVRWVGREVLHVVKNVEQVVVAAGGGDLPWDALAAVLSDLP